MSDAFQQQIDDMDDATFVETARHALEVSKQLADLLGVELPDLAAVSAMSDEQLLACRPKPKPAEPVHPGLQPCWNCLHPVSVHGIDRGCLAGLHAKAGTLLSMTGCACALAPADAAGEAS